MHFYDEPRVKFNAGRWKILIKNLLEYCINYVYKQRERKWINKDAILKIKIYTSKKILIILFVFIFVSSSIVNI